MNHVSYAKNSNSAIDDLKELDQAVAIALMRVAETQLKSPRDLDPEDYDEATDTRGRSPLLFRRGLTPEKRRELNEAEARDLDASKDDDDDTAPWNYVLIYRRRTLKEAVMSRHRGFMVLRVLHNRYLAPEILRLLRQGRLSSG